MNDLISALILAVVQGLTEWIPVSSSGHLVLAERILGYQGGLVFVVALHFGTLMAVFVYFGKDITDILQDFFRGKWKSENGKLGLYLIVATIPAVILGIFLKEIYNNVLSNLGMLALGFGITGLFLFIASIDFHRKGELGFGNSFIIGLAQALALLPGISRSGSTISTGLLLGLNEKQAMKFSFLMVIPIVFGANILEIGNNTLPSELIWATLVAFIVGLIMIHLLYSKILTSKKNLRWFGAYALLLALGIGVYLVFW